MDKNQDLIAMIKAAGLTGRGGAGFPTGTKWEAVRQQAADKKYIICNGSEGEPGVFKDRYLLEQHPETVVEGIRLALETIDHSAAYIYLNHQYYHDFKEQLERLCAELPITVFEKHWGYLGGEETAACEVIEGRRPLVRQKPPFPTQAGLWGCPTLINNVETFYQVARIARGEYQDTRFFSLSGDLRHAGVFEFPSATTMRSVLERTDNYPANDFFVQAGGGASGEILLPAELDNPMRGTASLIVFDRARTDPYQLMQTWADFFLAENCDKCVPCREGVYRISQMVAARSLDRELLADLFFSLENSSSCALGRSVAAPFRSLINKVL